MRSRVFWPGSSRRAFSIGAAALVLVSCSGARPPDTAPAARITGVATGALTPSPSPTPSQSPRLAEILPVTVIVRDAERRRLSGVDVLLRSYATEATVRITTDADGEAHTTLRAGHYQVSVPTGCSSFAEVFKGDGGLLGVARGSAPTLNLKVEARRRFWPGTPITWSPDTPWRPGDVITYRYSIFDRCKNQLAANVPFTGIRYEAKNLRLNGTPELRSDAQAYATVRFSCIAAGDASLIYADPHVREERVDLLTLKPPFDATSSWCGS